jgi:hypothetical protein
VLGGLVSLTVFSDPRVYVDSVTAGPAPGGFRLSATAHLN